MNSFYSKEELMKMPFKSIGNNVLLSRKASFYGMENISLGNDVRIDDFCILSGIISTGNCIHISAYSGLFAGHKEINIHDFSTISSRVLIYAESDDYSGTFMTNPMIEEAFRGVYGGTVILNRHSIIGSSSVILPGVILGEGAAVGACSLVKNDCKEWSIYAGIPARLIKPRNRNLLELEKKMKITSV